MLEFYFNLVKALFEDLDINMVEDKLALDTCDKNEKDMIVDLLICATFGIDKEIIIRNINEYDQINIHNILTIDNTLFNAIKDNSIKDTISIYMKRIIHMYVNKLRAYMYKKDYASLFEMLTIMKNNITELYTRANEAYDKVTEKMGVDSIKYVDNFFTMYFKFAVNHEDTDFMLRHLAEFFVGEMSVFVDRTELLSHEPTEMFTVRWLLAYINKTSGVDIIDRLPQAIDYELNKANRDVAAELPLADGTFLVPFKTNAIFGLVPKSQAVFVVNYGDIGSDIIGNKLYQTYINGIDKEDPHEVFVIGGQYEGAVIVVDAEEWESILEDYGNDIDWLLMDIENIFNKVKKHGISKLYTYNAETKQTDEWDNIDDIIEILRERLMEIRG